jgi:hypothetical protein
MNKIKPSIKLITLALLLISLDLYSATISRVSIDDLVNKSELIFDGRVIAATPRMNERGYIHTYIDFRVDDVLFGNTEVGNVITLRFSGGAVDGIALDVGVIMPKLDEQGIYFVEAVKFGLINPLFGWSQGHFLISEDDSVIAGNNKTIKSVTRESVTDNFQISKGVPFGVNTNAGVDRPAEESPLRNTQNQTMHVDDFKSIIRDLKKQ